MSWLSDDSFLTLRRNNNGDISIEEINLAKPEDSNAIVLNNWVDTSAAPTFNVCPRIVVLYLNKMAELYFLTHLPYQTQSNLKKSHFPLPFRSQMIVERFYL